MINAQLRYVFDRKNEADNSNTTGLLYVEIRESATSKKVYISTGIKLYKNQFSKTNGFTCQNHANAIGITAKARALFAKIEKFVLSEDCKSFRNVKDYDQRAISVMEFMQRELKNSFPTKATLEHHNALIAKIEDFGKIKTFEDVTRKNIIAFDEYLKRNGVIASATLNKRHTTFRRYLRKAIYFDLLEKDPYVEFKMPSKKSKDPVFLVEEEINAILNYKTKVKKMEHVRDLFVFQIFTGLAFTDLMSFNKSYITRMGEDKIISGRRTKTQVAFVSLFLPEAEEIAEKYDYNLPKLTNQKYNDYLKLLIAACNIDKNVTTHVARHTFATYLLNKDIPIETVSKTLGHTNIRQTQHYAKLLEKKVVSDMKSLLNPVKK